MDTEGVVPPMKLPALGTGPELPEHPRCPKETDRLEPPPGPPDKEVFEMHEAESSKLILIPGGWPDRVVLGGFCMV